MLPTTTKEKLLNLFEENNWTTKESCPLTWAEIGIKLGTSGNAARKAYNRIKKSHPFGTNFTEYCEANNINKDHASSIWVKTDEHSIHLKKEVGGATIEDIEELLGSIEIPVKRSFVPTYKTTDSTLILLSDPHIGMEIKDDIFGYNWDREELFNRTNKVFEEVEFKGNTVDICILGDINDGHDGKTTRRSPHDLPQNMSNKEKYKTSIEWMCYLVESTLLHTGFSKQVNLHIVSNSNHGGEYDFFASNYTKLYLEKSYGDGVNVNVIEKYIDRINIGNIPFLLSHGYDEQYQNNRSKMPKDLSKGEWRKKIEYYMDFYGCEKHTYLLRGDLHQYHYVPNGKFTDILLPSFAPASAWVQHNFPSLDKGGYALGYVSNNQVHINPYKF